MKTYRVWIVLFVLSGFCLNSALPQANQNVNNKTIGVLTSDIARDTAAAQVSNSGFCGSNLLLYRGISLSGQQDLFLTTSGIDYLSLKYNSSAYYSSLTTLTFVPFQPYPGVTDTINSKLFLLTLKPVFPVSGHHSHSKKTSQPAYSDNILYRLAGSAFKAHTNAKYPRLAEQKK